LSCRSVAQFHPTPHHGRETWSLSLTQAVSRSLSSARNVVKFHGMYYGQSVTAQIHTGAGCETRPDSSLWADDSEPHNQGCSSQANTGSESRSETDARHSSRRHRDTTISTQPGLDGARCPSTLRQQRIRSQCCWLWRTPVLHGEQLCLGSGAAASEWKVVRDAAPKRPNMLRCGW